MNRRQFTKTTGLGLVGLGLTGMPALASNRAPQNQVQSDWDRYTIRDRGFSALFPTTPAMSSYKPRVDPFSKVIIRNIIGAYSQGVVYALLISDRKQSLEEFIDGSTSFSVGKFKRELKLAGISGKEYVFQNDVIKIVTQFFITGRYIYMFEAAGSYLGNPDAGLTKFFESIKFEPTPDGLAIVDGPGEQPTFDPPKLPLNGDTKVLSGKEVTHKAVVITKPEPGYTEAARQNEITGTVVLRGVFSSLGAVTNIRALSGLPHGLTEQAIAASRQIKFIPAVKDGHFVSMYIQLEYNFNLY